MKNRIIVALDTDSPDKAVEAARLLAGEVGLFKVGMELFPRGGPALVNRITTTTEPPADVFLDLKYHDIPNTVAGAIRTAASLGVRFATVHAAGGRKMLTAAAQAAREANESGTRITITLLAVTVLTSLDDSDMAEIGFAHGVADEVLRLADLAVSCGVHGLVCSAKEVGGLRKRFGKDVTLVTPGVRLPSGDPGDQKRVVTPGEAVRLGADYLVVGRPILQAEDPVGAARAIARDMGASSGPYGEIEPWG